MTKSEFHKKMTIVGHHARILLHGLFIMFVGIFAVVSLIIAIAGFCFVSQEGGYVAVFDFIVSLFLLAVSLASMYFLGLPGRQRGGRYVE